MKGGEGGEETFGMLLLGTSVEVVVISYPSLLNMSGLH